MRSYEAARGLFSFMSFIGWLVIAGGVFAAIVGIAIGNDMGRTGFRREPGPEVLLFALPGLGIVLAGILTLAVSQVGRAGVDTAEYSQQMLQLSREHLEVSRQSLRHGEQLKTGFESLKAALPKEPSVSYADRRPQTETASAALTASTPSISYGNLTGQAVVSGGTSSLALDGAAQSLGTLDLTTGTEKAKAT